MLVFKNRILVHTLSAAAILMLTAACGGAGQRGDNATVKSSAVSQHYFKASLAPFAKISQGAGSSRQPDRFTAECTGDTLVTEYITGFGSSTDRTTLNLASGEIDTMGKQLLPPDKGADASSYVAALQKMQSVLEVAGADKAVSFIKDAIAQVSSPDTQDILAGRQISLEGDEATQMIDALFQSGIRDASGRLGALHLTVDGIQCSASVVPNAVPDCVISVGGNDLQATQKAADAMFAILKAHGAVVPRDLLGIDIVGASRVDCQKVTIRNGVNKCTFEAPH